jgi:membrane fusion protein
VRGTMTRRNPQASVSEITRARKREEFLARIRQASQVDVAAQSARPSGKGRETERAEKRPPARHQTVHLAPAPSPERVPVLAERPQPAPVQAERAQPERAPARAEDPQAERAERPQAAPRLFREEALKHRLAFEEGRGLVRVSPPWTWALLWIVVSGLCAAIATSFVGKVEVTGRGRGILRPATGVRVLTSQLGGTVVRVEARSGERVKAGASLLRIESPTVQAQLLEADRELEALRTQYSTVSSQQDEHYSEQIANLKARAKRVEEQIASLRSSAEHYERRVQADLGLLKRGLVSEMAVSETRDSLAQAQRQLSAAEQTLDQTRQELASLESRREDELWNRQERLAAAQNKRDALAVVLRQAVIEAPQDGTVEALLVKEGEVVQAGQPLGKLVPVDSPLQVVSFLAERDRAFAKPGDEVQLELDQLPHAQYGTLQAKVLRIGDDLASPSEIHDALGDQKLEAPSYRVELEITDARAAESANVKLRTGTLMNVRFTLRTERLITLVLNPLRRWFR